MRPKIMSAKLLTLHTPLIAELKKERKIKGYNDLKRELKKIWDMSVKVIPVVVGAWWTTPKKLKQRLSDIGIETKVVE